MVATLSHMHHIVTVNADAGGLEQFSIASTILPKLPQELSFCCEHLNAVVVIVSHIHIPSAVKCHIIGIYTASAAKATGECQVRVQNLNAVVVIVCSIHFLAVWVNSNTNWVVKFKRILPILAHCSYKVAIGCELLNVMILPIHHQYVAITIYCHTTRVTKLSMSRALCAK